MSSPYQTVISPSIVVVKSTYIVLSVKEAWMAEDLNIQMEVNEHLFDICQQCNVEKAAIVNDIMWQQVSLCYRLWTLRIKMLLFMILLQEILI